MTDGAKSYGVPVIGSVDGMVRLMARMQRYLPTNICSDTLAPEMARLTSVREGDFTLIR